VRLSARITPLELAETFTIARGSTDLEHVVHVELDHDGVTGVGEGAAVDYHGETAESMLAFVSEHGAALVGDDPFALEAIGERMAAQPGDTGAKMALDGALHDWIGKRLSQPVWRLLGVDPGRMPPTSYTIGIDTIEGTADRARRAQGFEVLKVKVGGADDLERLLAIHEANPARLRIDGNEGWTIETAEALMPTLVELGVEFVEQPFPGGDRASYRALRALSPRIPVILDESCNDLSTVAALAEIGDGINIKLAKSRGIREAVRMIHAARALELRIMLGCMIESELGIAQAAAIAPLVDYVDLDGHLLLRESPYRGLGLADGRLVLPDAPGLGVVPA
jgi:L-alanine-DL-glutamate epimerase-like enolase superfamily enzyme